MNSYTISVGGQSFQIRSDADAAHVEDLAKEVSKRYSALEKKGPRASQQFRAMAMVAIVLLDELQRMEKQRDDIRDRSRGFAEKIITRIDEILAAGPS